MCLGIERVFSPLSGGLGQDKGVGKEGIWLRMRKRDRISLNGKEREKEGGGGRESEKILC